MEQEATAMILEQVKNPELYDSIGDTLKAKRTDVSFLVFVLLILWKEFGKLGLGLAQMSP